MPTPTKMYYIGLFILSDRSFRALCYIWDLVWVDAGTGREILNLNGLAARFLSALCKSYLRPFGDLLMKLPV